jgi:hypothetical protein
VQVLTVAIDLLNHDPDFRSAAPLRMLVLRATPPPSTVSTTRTATWDSTTDPFDNNHLVRGLTATLP